MHKNYLSLVILSLMLLPWQQQITACSAQTFERSFDTLATSPDLIVARATWFQTDTIFDTIYRSAMLEELLDKYSTSSCVFITTAASAFFYRDSSKVNTVSTEDDIIIINSPIYIDSVTIHIDTVFKSNSSDVRKGYLFPIVTRYYLLTTEDPVSLSSLQGKKLFVFTNNTSSPSAMLPPPRARSYPEGFYLDKSGMIIHDKYDGISVPLAMFLSNLESSTIQKNIVVNQSLSPTVRTFLNGSIAITLAQQKELHAVQTAIFDLSGAMITKSSAQPRNNSVIVPFRKLSAGIYTIVISGYENSGKPFHTSVRHCIAGK